MDKEPRKFYVTTPIYYVNDRPHIGHVYTTTLADVLARYHRLRGDDVFFLTGTDEHAAKVADAAAERGLTALQWADQNAGEFQQTFTRLQLSHDDFIRTSEDRHKQRVVAYIQQLLDSGDVYQGEYEGWYDAGQEEYVPENKAQEYEFKSPVNGKALVRRAENNYFFRLSKYQDALQQHIEANPNFVEPDARRNEVLGRIREGLADVPISRTGAEGWGIAMPNDPDHTIYVWIDALFNYLTTVDTDERIQYWPADVQLVAKDILWFHAVIWPCMLMALGRPLPGRVYAHSYWISEGQKMSKSLGNFIDLERIDQYVSDFGLDALRYFLITQGPLGSTDSDFAHAKYIDVYNADLANTLGNCAARGTNMIVRYFDGKLPERGPSVPASRSHASTADEAVATVLGAIDRVNLTQAVDAALGIVRSIDLYIEQTQPFRLAKDPEQLPQVGTILYNCAEALRIASLLLWPVLPDRMQQLWDRLGCTSYTQALENAGRGDLTRWATWGQLQPGTPVSKGDPLFPRYDES
ncbi:MAG: methionine--tRNA ligase [Planctomycetaceae bacterium]|nr:methionine--tRNA ligase [Planctomycetaceae bacterium]